MLAARWPEAGALLFGAGGSLSAARSCRTHWAGGQQIGASSRGGGGSDRRRGAHRDDAGVHIERLAGIDALKSGGRGNTSSGRRTRNALVFGQTSLAVCS